MRQARQSKRRKSSCAGASGREAVEAIIAQIERDAQTKSPPLDPEITQMLRRELWLPAGS